MSLEMTKTSCHKRWLAWCKRLLSISVFWRLLIECCSLVITSLIIKCNYHLLEQSVNDIDLSKRWQQICCLCIDVTWGNDLIELHSSQISKNRPRWGWYSCAKPSVIFNGSSQLTWALRSVIHMHIWEPNWTNKAFKDKSRWSWNTQYVLKKANVLNICVIWPQNSTKIAQQHS